MAQAPPPRVNHAALRPYVPYVASWSGEAEAATVLVRRPRGGIAYRHEVGTDRDAHGVLWTCVASRPGAGEPQFGQVHSGRQRRAMRRLLCQVCGNAADRTEHGVLWLLSDHREDWPDWPRGMAVTEPPVCVPCAAMAIRLCPALRRTGTVALRVSHAPISGVRGMLYCPSGPYPLDLTPTENVLCGYDDARLPWVLAHHQLRTIEEYTFLDPEALRGPKR